MLNSKFSLNFNIGDQTISEKNKALIIAEIGINHEGNISNCLKMIFAAQKSGADIIKLQVIDPDSSYEKGSISYKLFNKSKLSREEIFNIYKLCKKKKIKIFSTFDKKNFEFFKNLNQSCYKISSSLTYDYYFIKKILATTKPTIISSGLSDLDDVDTLLNLIKKDKNKKIALLHCRSIYPSEFSKLHLSRIKYFRQKYKIISGYSDHSLGVNAPAASIHYGAKIIEKHFTLDKSRKSFDHKISLEPKEFKLMVKKIRENEAMIGEHNYKVFSKNQDFKKMSVFIRSFRLNRDVDINKILNRDDFDLVRKKDQKNIQKFSRIILKILNEKTKKKLKKGKFLSPNDFKK